MNPANEIKSVLLTKHGKLMEIKFLKKWKSSLFSDLQ